MVVQFDDVIVVQTIHNLDLVDDLFTHVIGFQLAFVHLLYRIEQFALFVENLVDFSKGT